MNKKELQNFQKKIELDLLTGCWNWIGSKEREYGLFSCTGKIQRAHRVSYEYWNGKIPKELQIDHLCRNRSCVNPEHLEAVTARENCRRGLTGSNQTNKTHCPK